jgi:hypothetical protein
MGTRRIKLKKGEKKITPNKVRWTAPPNDPKVFPTGRHYDFIVADDMVMDADHPLLGGPSATNVGCIPPRSVTNACLTFETLREMIRKFAISFPSWQSQVFGTWQEQRARLTKEEMAKQVELYKNVIEAKFGVKLCVKTNLNSDMITMELLVPTKLFADDGGRESLADALQNIAMFILNMEDPNIE